MVRKGPAFGGALAGGTRPVGKQAQEAQWGSTASAFRGHTSFHRSGYILKLERPSSYTRSPQHLITVTRPQSST